MHVPRLHSLSGILAASIASTFAFAAEKPEAVITPKIESVSLFKNGVAVMTATFPADKPGVYRWDDPPAIIHGTFAIESASPVAVSSALRDVERTEKNLPPAASLAEELAGSGVTLTLKGIPGGPVGAQLSGTVPAVQSAAGRQPWDNEYASLREANPYSYGWNGAYGMNGLGVPKLSSSFVPLEGANGHRSYVSADQIASVEVTAPAPRRIKSEKNTLMFTVGDGGGPVRFSFLCRGATWAPSYQLDLTDPAKLGIRQQALVRNEALPLAGAELRVISGFPNIRFATVDSPLAGSPLSRFFQQISQLPDPDHPQRANSNLSQQMAINANVGNSSATVPQAPDAEEMVSTEDLHFESIGRQSIEEGGTLLTETVASQVKYDRIVTWEIPDARAEHAGYNWDQQREEQFWQAVQNNAWDAVRFENPFKFALSGGTVMTRERGDFRGQSQMTWTAPGQTATVRVNKALSVSTSAGEEELPNTRKATTYAGRERAQARFKGTLVLKNLRADAVSMQVKVQYTGDFVNADEKPAQRLRGEGRWYLNPRRELEWQFKLAPGDTKTLTYQYDSWVVR